MQRGRGRSDRAAMAACKGDPRSMGHARRYFRPGQPLPDELGPAPGAVGFIVPSRAAGKVAGFFRTSMHGIEWDDRGVAATVVTGGGYRMAPGRLSCMG